MEVTAMKNWKKMTAALITVLTISAGSAFPAFAAAAEAKADNSAAAYKSGAVVPSENAPAVRQAAREKAMANYYITSGKKLDKAVALLQGIDPEKTGLQPDKDYVYRMDKTLTGDYFYHVKAFLPNVSEPVGDYLLAKDDSCAFRRFPGEGRTELLEGTTEKLMEKIEIYALYRKIPMESASKVFIRVPGNIPYTLTLTSLNENTLVTDTDETGQPVVYGIARGKADVLAEVAIGEFSKTKKVSFAVLDEKDLEREENRTSGSGFPIGIGIGIGIGHGHHHHGHGGVVIGI